MKKLLLPVLLALSLTINQFAAITVTSPSQGTTVEAAEDFAADSFQDPMDMNEQTDLGWFIFDVLSGSKSNLSNITFSNGIFSASAVSPGPEVQILETGVLGTCFLGKIGTNYKINADKYKVLAVRQYLSTSHDGLLFWSKNTIYKDITRTNPFSMYSGWRTYIMKIPSLGAVKVLGTKYNWTGNIDSLRLDPVPVACNLKIDWIRLVEDDAALYRTVSWTGNTGSVDIYLDDDRNEGNGTLGIVAAGVSGTTYQLYVGALAPGTYYIGVKPSSGGALAYGSGYYRVNDIPVLQFLSPSEEGGADFATTELGNAWDMNATSDLDSYANLSGAPSITTISAVNRAGASLGNIRVLQGTNKSGIPDPILYPLWFDGGRGATTKIDSNKYRILVLKIGLPGNWDLVGGSVARLLWHVQGEFFTNSVEKMNQSADIIIRHKSGSKITIDTIIADMKTLTLESSQSTTGWNGNIDGFRVDPHEFSASKTFYIQNIKLAAFERADDSYTFTWNYTDDIYNSQSLSLYYDTNNSGYNGTLIKSGLNPTDGQYTWNTSNLGAGTYYIYATYSDGINTNRTYARWPIVIDHSVTTAPTIALNKTSMTFNVDASNSQTFIISNSGSGTLNWTAGDNKSWMSVSPTSGQNSGTVTVTVDRTGLSGGTYTGTVTVTDPNATNSPQTIAVTLQVSGGGSGTPKIQLSRTSLNFGASGSYATGNQYIRVDNSGTGTLSWSASDDKAWLTVSPTSGTNAGSIKVIAKSSGLAVGTYTGAITVSAPNATAKKVTVTFRVYKAGTTSSPFGEFATPANNSTVSSSIPVTGWVLDDIDVTSVKVYNGSSYVGDAVFVEGARPDVEQAYSTYPKNYQAGWGYMLLTHFLPNGGNGKYTLIVKATDAEGHVVTLGSKTITGDNAHAKKPFGALDTPAQGGNASGSGFINWGWVLTPQPNKIPTNGSTIKVYVDGVNLGKPTYNLYRSDIATYFPGYANSSGASGKYTLNTTKYKNGVHSIQWTATDSGGNNDGIGSRYFTIQNTGSDAPQSRTASATLPPITQTEPRPEFLAELSHLPLETNEPLRLEKGYADNPNPSEILPDENGNITIESKELERIVLYLGNVPGIYSGFMAVGEELRPLPIGSSFDAARGIFYWGPGPGFAGSYEFVFVDQARNLLRKVNVNILPKY